MSDECIHGFENGLCAVCFPKAVPEATKVASKTAAPSVRAARSRPESRAAASRTPSTGRGSGGKAALHVDASEQRIYHVTHIRNLPAILASGCLIADLQVTGGIKPAVDISAPLTREARRTTSLPGSERSVAAYVPFFLSPNARLWDSIRSRERDSRLAPEVSEYAASEFVILVSTLKAVFTAHDDYSATDGDASGALTRFGPQRDNAERMLRVMKSDEESGAMLDAEFLVGAEFPFDQVALIGVSDERVRDVIKPMLADAGFGTKVAVYPPWFQPAAD